MAYSPRSLEISITVDGETQMRRRIQGVMKNASDMSPAMARIADRLQEHFEEGFASEGAATQAGQWADLSPAYRKWKQRRYPGQPILTRTGALRRAVTGKGPGQVRVVRPDSVTVGADVRVGRWELGWLHQKGTSRMPARRIISISLKARRAVMRELRTHLYDPRR